MTNQAAQTMPELPIPWQCETAMCQDLYTADQMHQYARDYAAALSKTAGVVVSGEMIERACKEYALRVDGALWPDAYEEHEVLALRAQMREFLLNAIGAAPAASSAHPDALPDGTLSKSTAKRVTALAAASVSERAREILGAAYRKAHDADPSINFCKPEWNVALNAVEQALTQQRDTTPQPSADAVRELVKRWRECAKSAANGPMFDGASEYAVAGTYIACADELESLLSAASGEKGVG